MWDGSMHPMGWDGWAGHGVGLVLMLLFWALVIVALVFLARALMARTGRRRSDEAALEILKRRYAQGEIDREEFERKRSDLMR